MELGIYSFGDRPPDPFTGEQISVADKLAQTLERIKLADELGLGFYGLGEHHLDTFAISSPGTVLAAAASITENITLSSAVSVLSTDDPVRLYQQFTTLDQLSRGRAELLAGRGSFTESFPLFGAALEEYDDLYEEKLDLLLRIDTEVPLTWSGRFRPALDEATIRARPYGDHLRSAGGHRRPDLRRRRRRCGFRRGPPATGQAADHGRPGPRRVRPSTPARDDRSSGRFRRPFRRLRT